MFAQGGILRCKYEPDIDARNVRSSWKVGQGNTRMIGIHLLNWPAVQHEVRAAGAVYLSSLPAHHVRRERCQELHIPRPPRGRCERDDPVRTLAPPAASARGAPQRRVHRAARNASDQNASRSHSSVRELRTIRVHTTDSRTRSTQTGVSQACIHPRSATGYSRCVHEQKKEKEKMRTDTARQLA
jgi:hypothetical protein